MKEINEMAEQEAKDKLKQARIKHTNCQIYLVGAIIFAASTTAVLFMETYRKVQLDLQVKELKDKNFYQSMKIRVLEWKIIDLQNDTAYLNEEIRNWQQFNRIK